ncbi:uncharacterized protein I303_107620 [Kwoniella dejecticola CBS 10117]|uniref:Haloacid dehalogenase, type II n=1 Tax=Kwoniella dejecticola CBS 10117 TaxID=1296121 RepID=A0A1A5ZV84_9TREE|nr:uncharacterized protein I303_07631 [Kwoniella dejecticola CBS 10117]OBR81721.1 hypothetical protein I303_07631 [Kwoniella dejecticola CBS 10117]
MSSSSAKTPVRLVLFDVFDTLCTPRLPVHEQYHVEAIKGGLTPDAIIPSSVRAAFKPAFKAVDAKWPLYGKHSNPALTPEEWWTKIIYETLLEAGADRTELDDKIGKIGPALMSRFESDEGYRNFPETIECLKDLRQMGVKTSIISNADPRILKTLDSLDILPLLTYPPTLSWDVEHAKPAAEIYKAACRKCEADPGEGVIMVGDELKADYRGSVAAGIEGRLIRRQGEWSDGAVRVHDEDLSSVRVITSLKDVVEEVRSRNDLHPRQ